MRVVDSSREIMDNFRIPQAGNVSRFISWCQQYFSCWQKKIFNPSNYLDPSEKQIRLPLYRHLHPVCQVMGGALINIMEHIVSTYIPRVLFVILNHALSLIGMCFPFMLLSLAVAIYTLPFHLPMARATSDFKAVCPLNPFVDSLICLLKVAA